MAITTHAIGEEDRDFSIGSTDATTLIVGEEDPKPTTLSVGEEDPEPTTMSLAEEDGPKSSDAGSIVNPFGAF
jgi:hypothetical protein